MNESALHFATRYAKEFGGEARVQGGNHIVMHIPGEGTGMGVTQVKAIWGINLIAWRVHPIQAKSIWAGANQQWFSFLSGSGSRWRRSSAANSVALARRPFACPTPRRIHKWRAIRRMARTANFMAAAMRAASPSSASRARPP